MDYRCGTIVLSVVFHFLMKYNCCVTTIEYYLYIQCYVVYAMVMCDGVCDGVSKD